MVSDGLLTTGRKLPDPEAIYPAITAAACHFVAAHVVQDLPGQVRRSVHQDSSHGSLEGGVRLWAKDSQNILLGQQVSISICEIRLLLPEKRLDQLNDFLGENFRQPLQFSKILFYPRHLRFNFYLVKHV